VRSEAGSWLPRLVSYNALISRIHEQRVFSGFLAQSLLERDQTRSPIFVAGLFKRVDPLFYLRFGPTAEYVTLLVLIAERDAKSERSFRRCVDVNTIILQNNNASWLPSVDVAQISDIEIKEQIVP